MNLPGSDSSGRPRSAACCNWSRQFPKGRLIAGATELGLDISKRYQKFPTLISVEAVPELKEIQRTDSEWRIGAAATLTQIEEQMAAEFPALADMLRVFGSRQVRNRATMGGNLVTASPIGDSAPVLLALDAKVVLVSLQSRTGAMARSCFQSAPSRSTSSSSPTARRLCSQARFSRPSSCPGYAKLASRTSAPGIRCPNAAKWTSAPWRRASGGSGPGRCRSSRAARLRRRGRDARAGAQDGTGAARQAVVRGDGKECCQRFRPSSRPSLMCGAARIIGAR